MERYGRAMARPGEPLLNTPATGNASSGVMSHMENSRGNTGTESAADKNVRLSNAADSGFNLLQKEWVQLSPYGDFPHAQGLQRVSFEAAKTMERNFATVGAKASRLFAGAPMFVGHPDVPQFANQFPDRKAYGWIMALEARPNGFTGA
jgi:hypothetical protein